MDTTFSSPLHPGAPKVLSTNESASSSLDCFDRMEAFKDRWAVIGQYVDDDSTKYWRPKGDTTEFRERLTFLTMCGTPSGEYCDIGLERFIPALAYDAASKKQVSIRRRVVTHAPSGEPQFPTKTLPVYQFVEQYEPADGWMTQSEWAAIKAELAPLIAEEKAVKESERSAAGVRHAQHIQATAARDNPTSALAAGIAAGVAEALKNLGIKSKG